MRTHRFSAQVCGVVAVLALLFAACSNVDSSGPIGSPDDLEPQLVVNGVDDFEHRAAAAIMVYDPAFPGKPGWRSFCGAALIHERVLQTAGHCIQFLGAELEAGRVKAVWVSFQQDPLAHFNEDPAVADPATGGWYEIESMHNNPDNIDFLALRQKPPEEVRAVWGKFHDSGAIVLTRAVRGIRPMKMVRERGVVERRLHRSGCRARQTERLDRPAGRAKSCDLLLIGYGLQEFPPVTVPPVQVRQSALLRYKRIDRLFVSTFDDPPGSEFGAVCLGDSGSPVVLLGPNGKDQRIVAISSSPADPFGVPCMSGGLQYRVDTRSHIRFINSVIESVRRSRRNPG